MNIPRCSHEEQTVIVSRATLFPEGARFTADGDRLAELNELLGASLEGFEVSQTRKRKKCTGSVEQSALFERIEPACKSGQLHLNGSSVLSTFSAFRLVSTGHSPKVISLEPRPLPERT
jgi:hypothetical protein